MKIFKVNFQFKLRSPFSLPVCYKDWKKQIGICVIPDAKTGLFELTEEVSEEDYLFIVSAPGKDLMALLITDELPYPVRHPIQLKNIII